MLKDLHTGTDTYNPKTFVIDLKTKKKISFTYDRHHRNSRTFSLKIKYLERDIRIPDHSIHTQQRGARYKHKAISGLSGARRGDVASSFMTFHTVIPHGHE